MPGLYRLGTPHIVQGSFPLVCLFSSIQLSSCILPCALPPLVHLPLFYFPTFPFVLITWFLPTLSPCLQLLAFDPPLRFPFSITYVCLTTFCPLPSFALPPSVVAHTDGTSSRLSSHAS